MERGSEATPLSLPGQGSSPLRKQLIFWGKLAAGVALVWLLYRQVNPGLMLLDQLARANRWFLLAGSLLVVVNIALAYWKWLLLLRSAFPDLAPGEAFGSLMLGYTLGAVTPGRLGELGRAIYLPHREPLPVTGLNLVDKFLNILVSSTVGLLGLSRFLWDRFAGLHWVYLPLLILSALVVTVLWVLVFNPCWTRGFLYSLVDLLPWRRSLGRLISGLEALDRAHVARLVLLTAGWYLVILVQYHCMIQAFTPVAWGHTLQAVSAMLFVKTMIPFSYGDLGVREGLGIYFYGQQGLPG
ncbi:MAG: UPF0104 family protein, partial [Calditrichaeota bacterium]